jgi:hypothetical protein
MNWISLDSTLENIDFTSNSIYPIKFYLAPAMSLDKTNSARPVNAASNI